MVGRAVISIAPVDAASTSVRTAAGLTLPRRFASTQAPPLKRPASRSIRTMGAAMPVPAASVPTTSGCTRPSRGPSDPSSSGKSFVLVSLMSASKTASARKPAASEAGTAGAAAATAHVATAAAGTWKMCVNPSAL